MKRILRIAVKDLKLISRDKLGLFFIIGFPVIMGLLFGIVAGSFSTEEASIRIALVDQDQSAESGMFVSTLQNHDSLEFDITDATTASELVRKGKLAAAIVIPEGFGQTAGLMWQTAPQVNLLIDPSRSAETGMLEGFIMQAMGELTMQRMTDSDGMQSTIDEAKKQIASDPDINPVTQALLSKMMDSVDGLVDSVADVQGAEEDGGILGNGFQLADVVVQDITEKTGGSEALVEKLRSKWDISFPQAMMWGTLACAAGFAVSLVRERERGTMLRLQVAPITDSQILFGKAVACFLAVVLVIALLVILGVSLGMRPANYPMLIVATWCVACCVVGIMMVMSCLGTSEEAVSGAAWGSIVLMAMFRGGMFPLAFMPGWMQTISNFIPLKWGVLAIEGAIWRDFSWSEIALPCLLLIGIGLTGMAIGVMLRGRWRS